MKTVLNMCEEDRQFLINLLRDTRDYFGRAFKDLAKVDTLKGKRKFTSQWCILAELAFAKPDTESEKGDLL